MKNLRLIGLFIISLSLICFIGCSKDDGSSSGEEKDLIGNWQAVKEEIDLTAINLGKITLTPGSPMFINMIVELKNDDTAVYETWNGTDKTAEGADYETGDAVWSVDGTAFSLDFNSEETTDLDGTYKLTDKNTLEISTTMVLSDFGPNPAPLKITMNRI